MTKSRFLMLVLALAFALMPTFAQGGFKTAAVTQINLRSGPGTEWRIVGSVRANTTILLDGQAFSGTWVRGITSQGVTGWMFSAYLSLSPDQAAGLPPVYLETPFNLSAPAQEGDLGGGSASTFTAVTGVNLRSGPGTEWRILGQLNAGEALNVDGRSIGGNWVRGINAQGVIGWSAIAYLSGDTSSLRVVTRDTPFGASAPAGGAVVANPETPVIVSQPIINTAPVSGFSYGGHVSGMNDNTFNWMRVAGMTWVKKQVRWEPGMDAGGVAGLIDTAHANGFRILLGIVGDGGRVGEAGYFDSYASYVAGVAGLGADAIEVWNEPNIDREWANGQISPAKYTELLAKAWYAIKGTNPNTMVISGAPAPTGFFGGCHGGGCDDNLYLAGMAAAGAANYMDCIGIHYNEGIVPPNWTSGDPRGNSSHYTRYYTTMVSTYLNAFGGSRPLCFTELGYLSPEGYSPLPPGFDWAANVTVGQQTAWLDQVVSMAGSSGRVRVLIIWNVDFQNYGADPMAGFAMIRPGNTCPACEALGR